MRCLGKTLLAFALLYSVLQGQICLLLQVFLDFLLLQPYAQARGGSWEEQPHVQGVVAARAQEGLEESSLIEGQEGQR